MYKLAMCAMHKCEVGLINVKLPRINLGSGPSMFTVHVSVIIVWRTEATFVYILADIL